MAFAEINDFDMGECVDWAIEMLRAGFDSPGLLILSGLTRPVNYFEGAEYLKCTLKELGIKQVSGINAVFCYSAYLVSCIAEGNEVRSRLSAIHKLSVSNHCPDFIHDLYLLDCAWGDLDYGEEIQYYWDGATKGNIREVVIETAKKWLKENEANLNVFA